MTAIAVPQVGDKGTFTVTAPFDTILKPDVMYTCVAVRLISELIRQGYDVYGEHYKQYKINEATYKEDLSTNSPIITFQSPSGRLYYIPHRYLKSLPVIGGVEYEILGLGMQLGALPIGINLESLINDLKMVTRDKIGLIPTIKPVILSETKTITKTDHEAAEAARAALIAGSDSYRNQLANAVLAREAALHKVAQLESYILYGNVIGDYVKDDGIDPDTGVPIPPTPTPVDPTDPPVDPTLPPEPTYTPTLKITPASVLVGDNVQLSVTGGKPNSNYKITVSATETTSAVAFEAKLDANGNTVQGYKITTQNPSKVYQPFTLPTDKGRITFTGTFDAGNRQTATRYVDTKILARTAVIKVSSVNVRAGAVVYVGNDQYGIVDISGVWPSSQFNVQATSTSGVTKTYPGTANASGVGQVKIPVWEGHTSVFSLDGNPVFTANPGSATTYNETVTIKVQCVLSLAGQLGGYIESPTKLTLRQIHQFGFDETGMNSTEKQTTRKVNVSNVGNSWLIDPSLNGSSRPRISGNGASGSAVVIGTYDLILGNTQSITAKVASQITYQTLAEGGGTHRSIIEVTLPARSSYTPSSGYGGGTIVWNNTRKDPTGGITGAGFPPNAPYRVYCVANRAGLADYCDWVERTGTTDSNGMILFPGVSLSPDTSKTYSSSIPNEGIRIPFRIEVDGVYAEMSIEVKNK
jgi:hypothetical protein